MMTGITHRGQSEAVAPKGVSGPGARSRSAGGGVFDVVQAAVLARRWLRRCVSAAPARSIIRPTATAAPEPASLQSNPVCELTVTVDRGSVRNAVVGVAI